MNKAFTKESDGDDDDGPERPDEDEEEEAKPRGPRHITPEGYRAMQLELERLWKVERPRVTEEVSVAAAHGDRTRRGGARAGTAAPADIAGRRRTLSRTRSAKTSAISWLPSQR